MLSISQLGKTAFPALCASDATYIPNLEIRKPERLLSGFLRYKEKESSDKQRSEDKRDGRKKFDQHMQ